MSHSRQEFSATADGSRFIEFENRLFTESRLRLYASGIVALASSLLFVFFKTDRFILANGKPRCIDFGWIWLSGKFAVSSEPSQIYDYAAFSAAQLDLFGPVSCSFIHYFDYPPTLLFFTYPLALMPYTIGFIAWNAVTLLLYLAAAHAIVSRSTTVIAALATWAVPANLVMGHNGFLTAALVGFSLVFMERRPWLSGIFVGLLTYKPQFGVLFPLALLASRNWRALGSAAASSVVLGALAAISFGYRQWPSFIGSLVDRNSSLSPEKGVEFHLLSVFGLFHWAGAGVAISWTVHLAVAATMALAVLLIWAKPVPYSLQAAALSAGTVIVSPYVHYYDTCILTIAVAFLVKDGLLKGFLPGERIALVSCFILHFLMLSVTWTARHVLCVLSLALIFTLIVRRVVRYRRVTVPARLRVTQAL